MPSFGRQSLDRRQNLDKRWWNILDDVIAHEDFKIICTHRDVKAQTEAYESGLSTLRWPISKHNSMPSLAVDLAPWHVAVPHIRWKAEKEFVFLAGRIIQTSDRLGIWVRWGGDWDGDSDLTDQTFMDLGHFEILDG